MAKGNSVFGQFGHFRCFAFLEVLSIFIILDVPEVFYSYFGGFKRVFWWLRRGGRREKGDIFVILVFLEVLWRFLGVCCLFV